MSLGTATGLPSVLMALRRYVYGFVNSHDFDVARTVIAEDYVLHAGTVTLAGREDVYLPAVADQMRQFPQLSYTVHDLITDGESVGVVFTEHGRSLTHPDRAAAWLNVGIYRGRDTQLVECWVEQDLFSRRRQLEAGVTDPILPVAVDPWSGHDGVATRRADELVDAWVRSLKAWPPDGVELDPGPLSAEQPRIDVDQITVNAVVTEWPRVAFNITVRGRYAGGLPGWDDVTGAPIVDSAGLFGQVTAGGLDDLRGVSNRATVQRQLKEQRRLKNRGAPDTR
jgi:hypothetical protein